MLAPSRKRALDNHAAKLKAAGFKQATYWLSEAARAGLERAALVHGSKAAAIEAAFAGFPEGGAKTVAAAGMGRPVGSPPAPVVMGASDLMACGEQDLQANMAAIRAGRPGASEKAGPRDALTGEPITPRGAQPKKRQA